MPRTAHDARYAASPRAPDHTSSVLFFSCFLSVEKKVAERGFESPRCPPPQDLASPSKLAAAKAEKKRLRELKKTQKQELERVREQQNAKIAGVRYVRPPLRRWNNSVSFRAHETEPRVPSRLRHRSRPYPRGRLGLPPLA